jgi:hypothetical protein
MEVLSSRPRCFTLGNHMTGGQVGVTGGVDAVEKGKISCWCCKLNHDFLIVQLVV